MTQKEAEAKARKVVEVTLAYLEVCEEMNIHPVVLILGNEDKSLVFSSTTTRYVENAPIYECFDKLGFEILDKEEEFSGKGDPNAN